MEDTEIKALLRRVKSNMRVTKIVATRSIKTKGGDFFVGFSAAWDTVQEDGGQGLVHVEDERAEAANGMTLQEARVAYYLLAMQADISAHEAALANGALSATACSDASKSIRNNYGKLIRMVLNGNGNGDPNPAK